MEINFPSLCRLTKLLAIASMMTTPLKAQSRLWDKIAALKPFLLDFQEKAGAREIPIVILRRA